MTSTIRLTGPRAPAFSTPLIDPAHTIHMRLDGRMLTALRGDTVLSAALANGIDIVGTHEGYPVGLTDRFAPPVSHRDNVARPDLAVPMDLCPAEDGMDLVTIARRETRRGLSRLFPRPVAKQRSLGIALDRPLSFAPWLSVQPTRIRETDCVVVGGGLAGMAAAIAAAERGLHTILVDDQPRPGGMARAFGRAEDEPDPDDAIPALIARLEADPLITCLPGTRVLRICEDGIDCLSVILTQGVPHPLRQRLRARHTVLATGSREILPVFAGNRLPGVVLSTTAWSHAQRFALWPGPRFAVHTAANTAYRLARLGADSGQTALYISDPRPAPQSRFIAFSKAYGFRLRRGLAADSVALAENGVAITHRDAASGGVDPETEQADALIVSGGFVPELTLWLAAGGRLAACDTGLFRPEGAPFPGLAVAGSAAGTLGHSATLASGRHAIAALIGEAGAPVQEMSPDPAFETPQGAYPPPQWRPGRPPAYLGGDPSLAEATGRSEPFDGLTGALTVETVIGHAAASAHPPADMIAALNQRCVIPVTLRFAAAPAPEPLIRPASWVPGFLHRRFGPTQHVWRSRVAEGPAPRRGTLLHRTGAPVSATEAVGTVLGTDDGDIMVLLGTGWRGGARIFAPSPAGTAVLTLTVRENKAGER